MRKRSVYHFSMPAVGSKIYDAFQYPAGEWQVRIKPKELAEIAKAGQIRITARPLTSDGIMQLALLMDALRELAPTAGYVLGLPYLPYGRADRRFVAGDCAGLKAFGSVVRGMGFSCVLTLDAHSEKAFHDCFSESSISVSPLPFIERAVVDFSRHHRVKEINILFPDKGALERYDVPLAFGCNSGVIHVRELHCEKRREPATGKLLGFKVPSKRALAGRPSLIVDDICDGGGTFLGIAEEVAGAAPLGLYVTHGVFSRGLGALQDKFSSIYTTDSIESTASLPGCISYPCSSTLYGEKAKGL